MKAGIALAVLAVVGAASAARAQSCKVNVAQAMPEVPVTITGDTIEEFLQNANSQLGDGGHMVPEASDEYDTGTGKNGVVVTKAVITVTGKVKRPRLGMSRAKGSELALIKQAEKLIQAHEKKHRDTYLQTMTAQACKGVVGKSAAQAKKAVDAAMCKANKAQEAIDQKDGMLVVVTKGGTKSVKLAPASGASYPCN